MEPELMDRAFDVEAEAGLLVLYDPTLLRERRDAEAEWWGEEGALAAEAAAGRLAPIVTGAGGTFRVLVTPRAPAGPARATSWLETSGRLCVIGAEWLPSEGDPGPRDDSPECFTVPPGRYRVEVRTPASEDPDAPDYALTLAPLPLDADLPPLPAELPTVAPAEHPCPDPVDEEALEGVRERMREVAKAGQSADARRRAVAAVLKLDPRQREALRLRAELKAEADDLEAALADVVAATRASPSYGEGWRLRAHLLTRLGRPEEAARSARRAVELRARDPRAWRVMGDALSTLGRSEDAVACWEEAIRLGHTEKERIRRKIARAAGG